MKNVKTLVSSSEEFMELLKTAAAQALIVLDTEYHKTDKWGEARIIGVAWGYPVGSEFHSFYAPFRHGEFPTTKNLDPSLLREFDRLTGAHIYHNYMADRLVFSHEGVDLDKRFIWDTMVMSHLVNENEFSYSLDSLSQKYFKVRKVSLTDLEKDLEWHRIPPVIMGDYACTDVYLTYRHYVRCRANLQQQKLENLYYNYEQFIKVLAKVVGRGLHIDVNLALQLQEEGRRELSLIESELNFKPSSQQRVAKLLHDELGIPVEHLTKKGGPSTSSLHLRRYSDKYPEVQPYVEKILRYRSTYKAVSTWYEGFLTKRGVDGLLHPGLTIVSGSKNGKDDEKGGTRTGRLSCREPNLQQVPRSSSKSANVRRLFLDPPGYRLVELDYSQAELRLIGWYMATQAGDPVFRDAYTNDEDIHSLTAEKMGLTVGLPLKEARQVGKTCNFSLCYRAGPAQLQNILYRDGNLDVSLAQARTWHQAWHAAYPAVTLLNEKAQRAAEKNRYVKFWSGRRRHLEGNESFKAFNSVIQGGVGAIMVSALIEIDKQFPNLRVVNQVHDSFWCYIKEEELDIIVPAVIQLMEKIPTEQFDMPFKVDSKLWNS